MKQKAPKISANQQVNWRNNDIQFPRLIHEIEVAGGFTSDVIESLCESMDLTTEDLMELLERACQISDEIKAQM